MKLTKADSDVFHRVLVVGLSGSGKSTLVSKLAAHFRLIWIDLENSKDVLIKLDQAALDNITYIGIPDSASFPIAAQTLMDLFKNNRAEICEAHGKNNCAICKKDSAPTESVDFTSLDSQTIVVVDSITQLSASLLAYLCKDKPVTYKPLMDDWGGLRKYTEFFSSQFQAFPGNLVCMCQAVEAEMEDGKSKIVPAFGSKDMSTKIPKSFGDVIYVEVKNRTHMAFSSSVASNVVLSKSRSDFEIESLPEPSLIPLFLGAAKESGVSKSPVATPAQTSLANLKTLVAPIKK